MPPYTRKEFKFGSRGICLSRPPDLLDELQYPYLLNMRQFQQGILSQRPGMAQINSSALADLNVHSIIRLNNYLPGASQAFARYLGAGSALYSDDAAHTAFTSRATGFSGKPLQFVVMRPSESPEPWLYVGDASKSGKARVNGTFYNHGIAPPVVSPYAQPAATSHKVIDSFEAVGAWTNGGTAGAITAPSRIATTISKIVYDTGTTGWATVQPATLDEAIQPGMLLITGGAVETVLVESVSEAVTNTTIGSIKYDSGTTGPCTIQLAAPTDKLGRDSMLRIDSGGANDEVVRVLSVTEGLGGLPSFRCSTVNTQAAARTITGVRSFRAYFASNHVAAEALASNNLRSSVTVGTGYISLTGVLDLSTVNSRPITDEDEIHISIKLDDITLLTEGRISFDVDSATNDFTQNYFYKPFRANDLAPATTGAITTLAAQQRIIQRGEIDTTFAPEIGTPLWDHIDRNAGNQELLVDRVYGSGSTSGFGPVTDWPAPSSVDPSTQTSLGAAQWTELRFKVKDLVRVGSDTSRGLHDVAAIRIQLQVTGTVQLDADAWWIGGTFGADSLPNIGVGAPYNYRYVYRSSLTGAESNPSPPMRSGIMPRRQQVTGTATASADAQVDYIDIYRTGGALITNDGSPPWFYVMSVPNSAPTFTDSYADDIVIRNRQLDFDNFQPFLDLDVPRSGVCSVVGTEVTRVSGNNFNTAWPAGTIITIDNAPYPLFVQPASTSALSLTDSAGTLTNVTWFVTTPRLMAQPMPAIWGPFGGGLFEPVIFACGSQYQSGHVFWTTSGAPDSNSQFGSLELTNPGEPLMNGCIFRSQAYVFSSEALYVLQPTMAGSQLRFTGAKVAGNRGLFSRYALCVGDEGMFYLSRDGIYLTAGSESISLTDEMLYPLFPHEGAAGITVNGIAPPDFTQPEKLRLSYCESELYFDFVDTGGTNVTLIYDLKLKGWFYYDYTPGVLTHYLEEGSGLSTILLGGVDGKLYSSGGATDQGTAISCAVWTPWFDAGDPRILKQWGDGLLDWASSNASAIVRAANDSETLGTITTTTATRNQKILDFNQVLRKNVSLRITNVGGVPLTLYGYDFTFVPKPETTIARDVDWETFEGTKYVRGLIIEADTEGVEKTVQIQGDEGVVVATLAVNHATQVAKPYAIPVPFTAHTVRMVPTDTDSWRYFRVVEWIVDDYPELSPIISEWDDAGYKGAKFLQGMVLEADTADAVVTLQILKDEGAAGVTVTPVQHDGRSEKPYSWEPFITHQMQIVPNAAVRRFGVRWVYDIVPELTEIWKTDASSLQFAEYGHCYYAYIKHISTTDITFTVTIDGTDYVYTIPHSSGVPVKDRVVLQAVKGKLFQFALTSEEGFRLYQTQSCVYGKPWRSNEFFTPLQPFGEISSQQGARI